MTQPPETPRETDWWDRLYHEDTSPLGPAPEKPAEPDIADDEDTPVEDDPRYNLLAALLGHQPLKKPGAPDGPECPHERTVPVHAQPYGELVAMLCLDCDEQLDAPEPAPAGDEQPARKTTGPGKRRAGGGRAPAVKRPQRRRSPVAGRSLVRPIVFTLSAGLFGWSVGLVDVFGSFLPSADHGAEGVIGGLCSLCGGYGAWRVLGVPGVAGIVPAGIVGRAIASVVVATVAPGLAPDLVTLLNQYGAYLGLNASAVALLATAGGMVGGLYWLVDRRFRAMPWPVRWLVRIPLASACLAVALYSPGPR